MSVKSYYAKEGRREKNWWERRWFDSFRTPAEIARIEKKDKDSEDVRNYLTATGTDFTPKKPLKFIQRRNADGKLEFEEWVPDV